MPVKINKQLKNKIVSRYFDYNLLAVVVILICFGLVMLYSASSYEASSKFGNDLYYLMRQGIFALGALAITFVIVKIDYHIYFRFAFVAWLISLFLMAMVKYSPFGITAGGARRWLGYGAVQFQPSEVMKITLILFASSLIVRLGREFYTFFGTAKVLGVGAISAAGAYYFTDNLSTGIIIFIIDLVIVFVAHPKTWPFILAAVLAFIVLFAAVLIYSNQIENTSSFRLKRVLVWLNPEKYSDLGGYQVLQGLYAIGSGGFFGKGLGNSTQKLDTIPEAQNDMIFSIICEELGVFGAIVVVLLFAYLLYRILCIARSAPDLKGTLIATGVFAHISVQVILNICVVLNVIPTTGVTLPFFSYGGTSIIFLMMEIGLVLGVSRQINIKVKAPVQTKKYRVARNKVIIDKR